MIIDCDRCAVRGDACRDCVVGVFLGVPSVPERADAGAEVPPGARAVQLDAPEARALSVLAEQGLVPRLRLVPGRAPGSSPTTGEQGRLGDTG